MQKLMSLVMAIGLMGWLSGCASDRTHDETGLGAPGGTTVYGPEGAGTDSGGSDELARPETDTGTDDMFRNTHPGYENRQVDPTLPDPGSTHDSGLPTDGSKGPL